MSYSSKLVNLLLIFFRRKFLSNFKIGVKYVKSLKAREKNSLKAGEKYPSYIDWVESETHKGLVSGGVQS